MLLLYQEKRTCTPRKAPLETVKQKKNLTAKRNSDLHHTETFSPQLIDSWRRVKNIFFLSSFYCPLPIGNTCGNNVEVDCKKFYSIRRTFFRVRRYVRMHQPVHERLHRYYGHSVSFHFLRFARTAPLLEAFVRYDVVVA
jgi:hypothetical protein